MARINTCSVCGGTGTNVGGVLRGGQLTGKTGRIMVEQDLREDPSNPQHLDFKKHGSAVGTFLDVCLPDSTKPGSEKCLASLIAQNPYLKFKAQNDSNIGERWSW